MMSFLHHSSRSITGAALIIGASSLLARMLGVLRDRILAGQFGAGDLLDVYYASFRIPDMLYDVVVLGALSAAFLPILTEAFQKKQGWHFASHMFNVIGVALMVAASLMAIFAEPLIGFMAHGFSEEQRAMATMMTRLLALSPLFLGLSSVLGVILQVHKRFFLYSLSPIFYNLGIIVGVLVFVPWWGIYGLALGVVFGAFLHFIFPFFGALALGFRPHFFINLKDTRLRHTLVLGIPRILSSAGSQINMVVMTIISSTLSSGSLSAFNFANNIQSFPLGIIGVSLVTAVFPTLAENVANGKRPDFLNQVVATLRNIVFFITPAAVLLLALRAQIVRVILGSGRFDWEDTIMTSNVLAVFAVSLLGQALVPLLNRAFYALKNSWFPFMTFCLGVVVNIILSVLLAPSLGVVGLALAFSLASLVNFSMLFIVFALKQGDLLQPKDILFFVYVMMASILMVFTIQGMKYLIAPLVDMQRGFGIFFQGFLAGIAGLVIYGLSAVLLRVPEATKLYKTCRSYMFYDPHS